MHATVIGICLFAWLYIGDAQRVVDTEYGQVRGHLINVYNGIEQTTVDVFYGIPFAKPPLGNLRFLSPVAPDPWTGILEADTIRDMCAQASVLIDISHPEWDGYSEDCLHLNIYTPTGGNGPYPVMFWIYGGAFQTGGTVMYPGHFIASRGVVVVTVNYRVNNLGFSYTGNDACPGNAGLWDQNAGLKFVVNNIANFGGDPNHITVFGQSAGGASTSLQMLSPYSKDLFQQAIPQSGTENNWWSLSPPSSDPVGQTREMAQDLDCDLPDDYEMMDCLREKPWRQFVFNSTSSMMLPVVDGPGGFLPEMPEDLRASGNVMSGPLMAGIAKDDGSLFVPLVSPIILLDDCCNRTVFERAMKGFVDVYDKRLTNVTEENCYRAMDYEYTPWPHLYDADVNRAKLIELGTDWQFGAAWDMQIQAHQSLNTTYAYVYDHMNENSTLPEWLGTIHAAEVDYLWGYPLLQLPENEEVANDAQYIFGNSTYTDFDMQFCLFLEELWTNFAKYGNPTPYPVTTPQGGSVVWPEFTYNNMDLLYMGDDDVHTLTQYRQREYAFWNEYMAWMTAEDFGAQ